MSIVLPINFLPFYTDLVQIIYLLFIYLSLFLFSLLYYLNFFCYLSHDSDMESPAFQALISSNFLVAPISLKCHKFKISHAHSSNSLGPIIEACQYSFLKT